MHLRGVTKFTIFFIMPGEVCIFCIEMISTLWGLTYKNIGKPANKIFNVPNHLNASLTCPYWKS